MEYAVIFLPLLGSIVTYFGKRLGNLFSQIFSCLMISSAAIISFIIFYNGVVFDNYGNYTIFEWINSGDLKVNWSIKIDPLSSIMIMVVTSISALVHIYSIGYMSHDPHKPRFMSYLSLFTFSMLCLVVSDNFLQLFFGWEGVGLCSYLLIGFWFKKETANNAAIKAFIVNRVGDFGLAIGIFIIFLMFGTLNFEEVFKLIPEFTKTNLSIFGGEFNVITLICVFLFIGAMGKSAQFFLHTWLPDAMEGPTPVSALIHAATMVTAGVFLVVRCSPMFEYSQFAMNLIAMIGMITALFAASVALVQNDIKKIIAYSTCSQLGYMFFAAGVGAYHIAMFHLFTHAFFKALLFLGAGSVIHSFKDEQDITKMGGVWKKIPYTMILMLIGTLALTGFPFLSGFYSKDAIIEFAFLKGTSIGYYVSAIGIFTAFLTAIYSWRLFFKTFFGAYNNKSIPIEKTHESPMIMIVPLIILSFGAILAGYSFKELLIGNNSTFWGNSILFLNFVKLENIPFWLILITPVVITIAIPLSYYLYIKDKTILNGVKNSNLPLYNFLLNKWYIDEIYEFILVKPLKKVGVFFWKKGDQDTIDRFGPDGISKIIKFISNKAIQFQSGYIYDYAFVMLIGLSALITYLIINLMNFPILSTIIFVPLLGAAFILLSSQKSENRSAIYISLFTSVANFFLSIFLWYSFDKNLTGFQFVEEKNWISGLIKFKLGIDGISILFIVLTAFITPICIISCINSIKKRLNEFLVAILVLETFILGVFCSLDLIIFYLFFEAGLIPMFLIIGIWGGPRKIYSAYKFFLFTLLGSVLMLAAIIFIYWSIGTTDYTEIYKIKIPNEYQNLLWLAFFSSFAVKTPMWPVHTWLPDAHVEAPTAGSVILAAILLKMAGYGFLRFSLGMFPLASEFFTPLVFTLSVIAIIYTSLVALMQDDMKKLIAYSSVAHMGFVTLGIFTFNKQGIEGSMFQMISHGIISAALFLCVGVLYDRTSSRMIKSFGGVVNYLPNFSLIFIIFVLGALGLPGTTGFIGEFLVLLGAFKINYLVAIIASTGVVLCAAYMLWMAKRVIFGKSNNTIVSSLKDINYLEGSILITLCLVSIIFGFYPEPLLDTMDVSVNKIIENHQNELSVNLMNN